MSQKVTLLEKNSLKRVEQKRKNRLEHRLREKSPTDEDTDRHTSIRVHRFPHMQKERGFQWSESVRVLPVSIPRHACLFLQACSVRRPTPFGYMSSLLVYGELDGSCKDSSLFVKANPRRSRIARLLICFAVLFVFSSLASYLCLPSPSE